MNSAYCAKHSLVICVTYLSRLLASIVAIWSEWFAYTLNTIIIGKNVLSLAFAHSHQLNIILRCKVWSEFPTYQYYQYCSSMCLSGMIDFYLFIYFVNNIRAESGKPVAVSVYRVLEIAQETWKFPRLMHDPSFWSTFSLFDLLCIGICLYDFFSSLTPSE